MIPELRPLEDVLERPVRAHRLQRAVDRALELGVGLANADDVRASRDVVGNALDRRTRRNAAVAVGNDVVEQDGVDAALFEIDVRLFVAFVDRDVDRRVRA